MSERYIGIENELTSFELGDKVDFDSCSNRFDETTFFDSLKSKGADFEISDTSIRAKNGLGFYVDGDEVEILTPPIAINKGFSKRLTDALMIGRNHVIQNTPSLKHTGYSMHWNLSEAKSVGYYNFFCFAGIPFSLFAQTPLSAHGVSVRSKPTGDDIRIELLGDSINNEEQIQATALLLGSASQAIRAYGFSEGIHPGFHAVVDPSFRIRNINFRNCLIEVSVPGMNSYGLTTAQEYLEKFYEWVKPFALELGNEQEVRNLEDFIFEKKKLEIDKEEEYETLKKSGLFNDGTYFPPTNEDAYSLSPTLKLSDNFRELPLEARLMGAIVSSNFIKIDRMSWSQICASTNNDFLAKLSRDLRLSERELQYSEDPNYSAYIYLNGIENIYNFGETLAKLDGNDPNYVRYTPPVDLKETSPTPIRIQFVEDGSELEEDLSKTLLLTDKKTELGVEPSQEMPDPYAYQDNRTIFGVMRDNILNFIDDVLMREL